MRIVPQLAARLRRRASQWNPAPADPPAAGPDACADPAAGRGADPTVGPDASADPAAGSSMPASGRWGALRRNWLLVLPWRRVPALGRELLDELGLGRFTGGPGFRVPGLRTAKTTLAAVLAFVVADLLQTSPQPVLAPLTALLVVQLTMYETVAHGLERVASVLAGVLVALGVAAFAGLHWWSLGAVVFLSLVLGRLLRLGAYLLEVPVSAMLVLAVGGLGARSAAWGRVYETLIGAAVGVLVNLVVAPPLHVRPAGEAIGDLAGRMAQFARGLADELRAGWSRAAADHWLTEARAFGGVVSRTDQTLARAEQSARLNPRGAAAREAQPRLRTSQLALEHCYITLRTLCRGLLDRTYFVPPEEQARAYTAEARTAIAVVLDAAAPAIEGIGTVATAAGPADAARGEVEARLAELGDRRDRLAQLLMVDPRTDQAAWEQHGAVLASIDRLRVEIEASLRPPVGQWQPPALAVRQRQAVRRAIDRAAQAAVQLQPTLKPQRGEKADAED